MKRKLEAIFGDEQTRLISVRSNYLHAVATERKLPDFTIGMCALEIEEAAPKFTPFCCGLQIQQI